MHHTTVTSLSSFLQTWKRKWFVLSQKDPFNPRSVELSYYNDSDQSGKKGSIDLSAITRIHPSPSKAKGHVFSIELKDKKIMLKADDAKTKNIWIAKLYEFAGQGQLQREVEVEGKGILAIRATFLLLLFGSEREMWLVNT